MKIKLDPPSLPLAAYVKYFWVLESCAETHSELVYPTGNFQLLFHYKNPFCNVFADGTKTQQAQFLVSGQKTGYRNVMTYLDHGVVGVELYPFAAFAFFPFSLSELLNQDPELSHIYRDWKNYEWQFLDCENAQQRVQIVESFLISKLHVGDQSDFRLVQSCLVEIEQQKGLIVMERLQQKYHMGERALERLFQQKVGVSPKKYCDILKFNHAIDLIKSKKYLSLTEIGYLAGYYDQSHFIKSCKQYTGHTPSSIQSLCA